ncbi:uncharacterized protein LOC134287393 [Aedes albopictus]|uniref:C2H2-type domain-containing protein n=1 Tax=Aedes albopictus TaxID=7160 RepID=A0ABM1Y497_AEDAL
MADVSIVCFFCRRSIPGYVEELGYHLSWHIRNGHFQKDAVFYDCTFRKCQMRYTNQKSLKRHIKEKHPLLEASKIEEIVDVQGDPFPEEIHPNASVCDNGSDSPEETLSLDDIKKTASLSICRLAGDVGLPQTKVLEAIKICENVVCQVAEYLEKKTSVFLASNGIETDDEESQKFLNLFRNIDLFADVKTSSLRKSFLRRMAVDIPVPEPKCLGKRSVTSHKEGIPKEIWINDTMSYIPIIDTLKLVFRNPRNREFLSATDSSNASEVSEYSSFRTGSLFNNSEYFKQHPNVIRMSVYQDDVELGNAFSSRAGKNKISNICFRIQNFPEKWNSSPSTIFPVIFVLSSLAKKHGYNKILEPLIHDLKKLEQGVAVFYGEEKVILKATVTAFCGDSLAMHDVFGLLGPSAKYFCRVCTISRPEFHDDPTKECPLRDAAWYATNLAAVQCGEQSPTECGLKACGSILNELPNFHITDNWTLDVMHDLAEGIIPLTLQLVMGRYVKQKDLRFTKSFINHRISTFNFGYVDRKNRPMANITDEMLSAPGVHRMKQTATQNFVFLRAFPFLFGHRIPVDCKFMLMIGHLINITRILLSPVVSADMLAWLDEHVRLYNELFFENFQRRINKSHHLQHYSELIRRSGSAKQFNCLPFEQKNKPLKNQAATCRNFKNICKSVAERQSFRTVIDLLENPFTD